MPRSKPSDEPKTDLTPYDLADRLVSGMPVTDAGMLEIAKELVAVRVLIESHQESGIPAHATIAVLHDRIDP